MCDEFVDNPDYDDSHYNEHPIGNLHARYRCFLIKPVHDFLPDSPHQSATRYHNAFGLCLRSRQELKSLGGDKEKTCYLTAPRKSAGGAGILALIYIMDGAPDRVIRG